VTGLIERKDTTSQSCTKLLHLVYKLISGPSVDLGVK